MDARFRNAARAYLGYGVIYWIGGVYLMSEGVGRMPGRGGTAGALGWAVFGLVLVVGIPFLLRRPRRWFERWILSRRDFARVLAVFMAVRAWHVLKVALRPETPTVATPWGGAVSFRAGAIVFFAVTVLALAFVVRAAWGREAETEPRRA